MSFLAEMTGDVVEALALDLAEALRAARSLEGAAAQFTAELRARFPTIVLARVFGTVPFARLPLPEQRTAAALASDVALLPSTDVLTLFGTSGTHPDWNDRRHSKGHLTIPLFNRAYVDEIPMVARLLHDLRFRLEPEPESPEPFVTRAFANANGLFYVPDAATTRDERGRHLIPAGSFVAENGIHSVLGFGGSYVLQPMFVATILFTREHVSKATAMHLMQLSSVFKSGTTRCITRGLLFEASEPRTSSGQLS